MHHVQKRTVIALALGVAFVASAGWIVHQRRQIRACRRQQTADQQTLHALRDALQQYGLQKVPAAVEGQALVGDYRAVVAKRDKAIGQLTLELSETRANIVGLQEQIKNSNDEHGKALASANESYRKDQGEWQNRLDGLKQELDASQADLQASRQRIAALETNNARLRGESSSNTTHASELSRAAADLQVLDRRREAYITSIMRRYRDITSEFRAMGAMIDSSHDTNPSTISGPALTHIQNTVSQADDDLRQLSQLNDQAHQLESKLARK